MSTQAYPDSCVGTDSHTTMINGLGVLGWGVGGIEAEAAMLGQPVSMLIPRVVGFKLTGAIPTGATATDVVLTITEKLRKHGVVGKFVEFYGEGVGACRSPTARPSATCRPSSAPPRRSSRSTHVTHRLPAPHRPQRRAGGARRGLLQGAGHVARPVRRPATSSRVFSEYLELDLGTVVPSIAGPKRPQDRISLTDAKPAVRQGHLELPCGRRARRDLHG